MWGKGRGEGVQIKKRGPTKNPKINKRGILFGTGEYRELSQTPILVSQRIHSTQFLN